MKETKIVRIWTRGRTGKDVLRYYLDPIGRDNVGAGQSFQVYYCPDYAFVTKHWDDEYQTMEINIIPGTKIFRTYNRQVFDIVSSN